MESWRESTQKCLHCSLGPVICIYLHQNVLKKIFGTSFLVKVNFIIWAASGTLVLVWPFLRSRLIY